MSRYIDYCEALQKVQYLEEKIREALSKLTVKVYNVYVAIGDEEEGTYFLDVEIGGSLEDYKRWYGFYSEERIRKMFNIESR